MSVENISKTATVNNNYRFFFCEKSKKAWSKHERKRKIPKLMTECEDKVANCLSKSLWKGNSNTLLKTSFKLFRQENNILRNKRKKRVALIIICGLMKLFTDWTTVFFFLHLYNKQFTVSAVVCVTLKLFRGKKQLHFYCHIIILNGQKAKRETKINKIIHLLYALS